MTNEHLDIRLQSNILTVNGNTLRAAPLMNSRSEKLTVSSEKLTTILLLGRRSILQGIEDFYEQQARKHTRAFITRPSVWTVQLGTTRQTDGRNSKVFTEQGYENGGILSSIDEIKPKFHPYWNAVREAGFLPEVRRASTARDGGAWILLRRPLLPDVLHHWFGYDKDAISNAVKMISDEDKEAEQRKLTIQRLSYSSSTQRDYAGRNCSGLLKPPTRICTQNYQWLRMEAG